jgi:hypothetical protein
MNIQMPTSFFRTFLIKTEVRQCYDIRMLSQYSARLFGCCQFRL